MVGSFLNVAIAKRYGPTWACLLSILLVASLVAITFIDIDTYEIPDEIVYPLTVLGALLRPFAFSLPWWDGIVAAVAGAGVLWTIRYVGSAVLKQEAMGLGDVKLIVMLGAFLGLSSLLPVIMVASLSGSVLGGMGLLVGRLREKPPLETEKPASSEEVAPVEAQGQVDEEDDWVPAPTALPFGPYLSLGALAYSFFGPALSRLLYP